MYGSFGYGWLTTLGRTLYEFMVMGPVTIGVTTSEFLEFGRDDVEIGTEGTYSFGYAYTGNVAQLGNCKAL
jgi:hypothetical protein